MADYHILQRGPGTVVELRKHGIGGMPILAELTLLKSERSLPPHFHKGLMEICYFEAGERLYFISGEVFRVKANHVFVSWPDEIHWVESEPYGKAHFYSIRVELPEKPRNFLGLSGAMAAALVEALRNMPRRCFEVDESMHPLLQEAFRLTTRPVTPRVTLELSMILSQWLLRLVRHAERPTGTAMDPGIAELLRLIDRDIYAVDSLETLAGKLGLSVSRLKAKFKREVGLPPWEYVLRKKIALSKELMKKKGMNITRMAFDLGFSSSQHFASTFRRFTGGAPRDFLKSGDLKKKIETYGNVARWIDSGVLHGYILVEK